MTIRAFSIPKNKLDIERMLLVGLNGAIFISSIDHRIGLTLDPTYLWIDVPDKEKEVSTTIFRYENLS